MSDPVATVAAMPNSTWEDRDLPVLCAIVEMADAGAWHIEPEEIAQRIGFDENLVNVALWALAAETPPHFEYEDVSTFGGRAMAGIRNPTGHARRTVKTWPTPEDLADRLTRALAQAADDEPDAEKRSKLRAAASWFGNAGRDVLVDVTAAVVTKSAGLG